MTTTEPPTTPSPRPRTLQADLLDDLRQAAPIPAARPDVNHSASAPAEGSELPGTPTVDVRVTPRRWSVPSIRRPGAGTGLVVTAGPVRVALTGLGR